MTRKIYALSIAVLLACAGGLAWAQQNPSSTVRIVTPYAPRGSTDILACLLTTMFSESWKNQFIVNNRPGGNTIIGTEHVTRSVPDGYTLMLQTSSYGTNPSLFKTPCDPIKDFTGGGTIAKGKFLLVVNPAIASNSVQEFIALARSEPGEINYASSGLGSSTHLANEFFHFVSNVKLIHVPYKGGGPALNDLLGGQVQISFNAPLALIPNVKAGQLRALAITGSSRIPALPQTPTFSEAGLPAFDASNWYAMFPPAGLPRPILSRWSPLS